MKTTIEIDLNDGDQPSYDYFVRWHQDIYAPTHSGSQGLPIKRTLSEMLVDLRNDAAYAGVDKLAERLLKTTSLSKECHPVQHGVYPQPNGTLRFRVVLEVA